MIFSLLLTSCKSVPAAEAETASAKTEAISEPAKEESTAEIRMLNDLINYIYQCEILYGDIQWVLDSFDRFDTQRTWEILELARSSLVIAQLDISKRNIQDPEMTMEDQTELMHRGVDVSFLENAKAVFDGEKTSLMNTCLNLHYGIMEGVYLQDDWDVCMQHVDLLKELISCDIQYLANTADWVLATLSDDEITQKFYDVMDSNCPLTRACQAEVLESPEEIEAITDTLLDHVDDLLLEESKILGAHTNRLNVMTELINQEDYVAIGKNLLEISNMPLAIFYPTWYDDEDIYYYWRENGEVSKTPTPGTILERVPDGCRINISGITKEELLEYRDELESAGLPCLGSSDNDGKLRILYECATSTFAFIWEEKSVTILMTENPVCFVPRWYLPAVQNSH